VKKLLHFLRRSEERCDPRCVVVDTETSGLDPRTDALLAIGAVAVDETGIAVEDSFEIVLRHEAVVASPAVLVHGLGGDAQRAGAAPQEALASFTAYLHGSPVVGYHVSFDRAVLENAGLRSTPRWLDLADLAATLVPDEHKRGRRALDDWLAHFAIDVAARHTAAGDALASAELFLRLRALAAAEGYRSHASLVRFAQRHRWL
jgi:DNA polymerase-3 subunit epsilon